MTRDEAVAWLRAAGHNASASPWGKGDTLFVMYGEPSDGEIQVYPAAAWLVPTDSGAWEQCEFSRQALVTVATFETLEAAVRAVHEYIARKEQELREASPKR